LTFEIDLDSVKLNQNYIYLGERLLSSKVIVRTLTHTHTHRIDCSTWTIRVVGKTRIKLHGFMFVMLSANLNCEFHAPPSLHSQRVTSSTLCRAHVQGLKRPCAVIPIVGFHLCCRRAVSTPTPLCVHRPVAGAVLPAVNDRTEGVPHRWCTCLERCSLWRYVCSLAGCLWTAFEDWTFSPLLQRCLTVIFSTHIVVLEMDFLFRPL